jgi:hypothetical protein
VQCADGSRAESAAPLADSAPPLHWRYELAALAWASTLIAPAAATPLTLAIDSAGDAPQLPQPSAARFYLAPQPMWLWALSAALSDVTPLRAAAMEALLLLLHTRVEAAAAGVDVAAVAPLPRVATALASPRYMSQLVCALAADHPEALAAAESAGGRAGALATGMHELLKPVDSVRPFTEYARTSLSPGAVSSLLHMHLFQALATAFPAAVAPALAAVSDLATASRGRAETPAPASAAAPAAAQPAAADAPVDLTAPAAARRDGHEASTLRVRQATVRPVRSGSSGPVALVQRRIPANCVSAANRALLESGRFG